MLLHAHMCCAGCLQMAQEFPASTFVGIDIDAEALSTASRAAQDEGLRNASFEVSTGIRPLT